MLTARAVTLNGMKPRRSICAWIACLALLTACGNQGGDPSGGSSGAGSFKTPFAKNKVYPLFVSSELVVGENRVLMGLLNEDDAPIGSPDLEVSVSFYNLAQSATEPVAQRDMEFVWMIPDRQGVYVTRTEFDEPGEWGAEVEVHGRKIDETVRTQITVAKKGSTPAVGDKAPASDTPTSAAAGKLSKISTDHHPDPRFYETSVADAIAAGSPFVLTFATPKFCQTAVCGPTLDIVKGVAESYPDMTFIHAEPFEVDKYPELVPTEVTGQWGLRTEPWVFVVDERGRIAAKFEGTVSAPELKDALDHL